MLKVAAQPDAHHLFDVRRTRQFHLDDAVQSAFPDDGGIASADIIGRANEDQSLAALQTIELLDETVDDFDYVVLVAVGDAVPVGEGI